MSISMIVLVLVPMKFSQWKLLKDQLSLNQIFLISANSKYAFPSGQSRIVPVGVTVAKVLIRGSSIQLLVAILLISEVSSICFSRVYIGGRYPLDASDGILLGVGVTFVIIWKDIFKQSGLLRIQK